MDVSTTFLIYAAMFRVAVVGAAVVCVVLGYRLFLKGVVQSGDTEAGAEGGGFKLTIKNAAPGTCFALFGAVVLGAMIFQASPALDLEAVTAGEGHAPRLESMTTRIRGEIQATPSPPSTQTSFDPAEVAAGIERFNRWINAGFERETSGDHAGALQAYDRALSERQVPPVLMAIPLNQVAWIFREQGKLAAALPLARTAVHLQPSNGDFYHTLALILEAQGFMEEAIETMQVAAQFDDQYQTEVERMRRKSR